MFRSMLQTAWWAKFKESQGWRAEKYGPLFGLTKPLPFGQSLLYFPEIPLDLDRGIPFDRHSVYVRRDDQEDSPPGRIFTRFEFLELWTSTRAAELIHLGLIKAFEDVQPEYRQWLMLDKSDQEILDEMKPKGRYNIGVAKKHQLDVKWGISDQSVKVLFDLYRATAKRADFQGRNLPYLQLLAQTLQDNNAGDIVVVSKDGQPLSALLISFYGGVASYLYGGSGGDRSLMAPYLAHWEAIRQAKKRDCAIYDLLAIAPEGQANHPHTGLTRFKTQFGGQSVRLLGSWDLIESRFWYTIYRFVERRRRKTTT